MHTFRYKQNGFTLIEIMVVVVILSILAMIVVPRIMSRPDEARVVKARQDIQAIENALDLYKLDNGFYPSNEQGLAALSNKPSGDPQPTNWKRYLKSLPKDPWQRPYYYRYPGEHETFDVYTNGADGKPGGTGINATIGNWSTDSEQ